MACPHMRFDFTDEREVPWGNRVADIPFGKLDDIFTGSEEDVAASAWAPGAGLPKPQYATWVKTNYSEGDAAIFNAEHNREW